MPIPTPHGGEDESGFVSRCMASDVMKKEFPDQKQRSAVCYSQFRKSKRKNGMKFNFAASILQEAKGTDTYIVGNAIKAGISRNNVNYSREELKAAAETLIGKPLLLNHGDDDVRNIVGKVVDAGYNDGNVPFKALLDSSETEIIKKIEGGFINKVSIGATFDDKLTERDENGVLQARGINFEELSLIPIPGVKDAGISQVLCEKYEAMEVEKMEKYEKEIEELKKELEEAKAKLKEAEEPQETEPEPPAEPEPAEPEPEEPKEDLKKVFEEKLAALEKKFESKKGLVKETPEAKKNQEHWVSSDKNGKKDYYELDTNGNTLY